MDFIEFLKMEQITIVEGVLEILILIETLSCVDLAIRTQYLVRSEDLDISNSIIRCPVCHMKSIECIHITLRQDGYSRFTSDILAVARIRNRNKVLDKTTRA